MLEEQICSIPRADDSFCVAYTPAEQYNVILVRLVVRRLDDSDDRTMVSVIAVPTNENGDERSFAEEPGLRGGAFP